MALPSLVQAGLTTIEAASGQLLSSTPGSDNTILLLVKNTGAGAPSGVVDGNGNTLALAYSYTAGYGDLFLYYRHTGGSEDADSRTFTVTGTVDAMGAIELAGKIQPVSPGNSVGANNGNPRTLNLTNLDAGNLSIVMGGCYYGANGSLPDYTEWRDSSSAEEWTYLAGYEAASTGSFSRAITLGTVAAGAFFVSVAATEWEHVAGGTPATLSAPTGAQTGATTASVGATTDTGSGTLYGVVTTSSTPPTATQVKNGQTAAGVSAPGAGNVAVSSTGAKTINLTGLSPATTYYAHLAQETTGGLSNVVTSASFVTASVHSLAATAAAQTTATAGLQKSANLAATAAASASAGAAMAHGVPLAAAAVASASATGAMSHGVPLAAGAAAVASAGAQLAVSVSLAAAAVATALATAQASVVKPLAIAAQGNASASADLSVTAAGSASLAAAAQGNATAQAALALTMSLGAAAQGHGLAGAALHLLVPLDADAQAAAAAGATLGITVLLAAQAQGQASATAALPTLVSLSVDGQAVATVQATLLVLRGWVAATPRGPAMPAQPGRPASLAASVRQPALPTATRAPQLSSAARPARVHTRARRN